VGVGACTNLQNPQQNLTGNRAMKFTNTDCVQIYEIISHPEKMQMIRQVCRGVYGIELFSRLPQYYETPSFLIRLKISQEINK